VIFEQQLGNKKKSHNCAYVILLLHILAFVESHHKEMQKNTYIRMVLFHIAETSTS